MPSARFRLRLFWYRLDKEAWAAAFVFGLVLGGLAFLTHSVYASRKNLPLKTRKLIDHLADALREPS